MGRREVGMMAGVASGSRSRAEQEARRLLRRERGRDRAAGRGRHASVLRCPCAKSQRVSRVRKGRRAGDGCSNGQAPFLRLLPEALRPWPRADGRGGHVPSRHADVPHEARTGSPRRGLRAGDRPPHRRVTAGPGHAVAAARRRDAAGGRPGARPRSRCRPAGAPRERGWRAGFGQPERAHRPEEGASRLARRPAIRIRVLDRDDRRPLFGARALEALPATAGRSLGVALDHVRFDWTDTRSSTRPSPPSRASGIVACSSEARCSTTARTRRSARTSPASGADRPRGRSWWEP